jgi:hypothetical protein
MAGTQTIKVTLQRDSLQTPWGFRLQGGADFRSQFTINKVSKRIFFSFSKVLVIIMLILI